MDRLSLFRLTTFQYFVAQISMMEGSNDQDRRSIWATLQGSKEIQKLLDRMIQMNTRERMTALSKFIDLLIAYETTARSIDQADWVTKVNTFFDLEPDDSDEDPADGVFKLVRDKLTDRRPFEISVVEGCSLISLDDLLVYTGIPRPSHDRIKEKAWEDHTCWRIKLPNSHSHLFIKYEDAADICKANRQYQGVRGMIEWLEIEASSPADDPADRKRLSLLEAVDTTRYFVTFLGPVAGKGGLVLLRASDSYIHIASFMRSFFGFPLRERDVRDEHDCAPWVELLNGQVRIDLDEVQMDALIIR